MYPNSKIATASAVLILSAFTAGTRASITPDNLKGTPQKPTAVLWREPKDIASRNLFYGPGGSAHVPQGKFTFVEENLAGSSPKFDVIDQNGVRWKVKMGPEVRPEVAASRLVWAVGYFANENYFTPVLQVEKLPRLHRGRKFVSGGTTVHNVRLKRHQPELKRIGSWSWMKDPFTDTREWYGLRVLMAVMNNWDLKDGNNAIYISRHEPAERRYAVSDLGASFGPTGLNWSLKGNADEYCKSKWIKSVSAKYVDFNVPAALAARYYLDLPEVVRRANLVWLGRHIPRAYARWMGDLLGRLSPQQIRDAFRAGGYAPSQVEQLSRVVELRIAELKKL